MPGLRGGSTEPERIFRGSTEVEKVMRGSTEYWRKKPRGDLFLPYNTSMTEYKSEYAVNFSGTALNGSGIVSSDGKNAANFINYRQAVQGTGSSGGWYGSWFNGAVVSMWVRHNQTQTAGGKEIIHRVAASSSTTEFYVSVDPAVGRLYAGLTWNGVWFDCWAPASGTMINTNTWQHIAAGFQRGTSPNTTMTIFLWVNGVSVASGSKAGMGTSGTMDNFPLYIGGNRSGTSWRGMIDDLIVSDTFDATLPAKAYAAGRR